MPVFVYMLAAVAVGAMVSAQPAWNAIVARGIGSVFGAAAINTFIGFAVCMVFVPVLGVGRMSVSTLTAVPWWAYLGGVVGALFVTSGVFVAPVTGALVFFVCVVTGQLVGSVIADHYGAFGLEVRPASFGRLAGVGLVVLGAFLVGRG